ncbi:hypothetical protein RYX36_011052 [Vicia faba]
MLTNESGDTEKFLKIAVPMKIRVLKLQKAALCYNDVVAYFPIQVVNVPGKGARKQPIGDNTLDWLNNAFELLVQKLHHLPESGPDENAAIYNTVATIEKI